MKTLKLCKPYLKCFPNKMTQGYHSGHKAVDYVAKYGAFLVAPCDGIITEVSNVKMTPDNKDYERGYHIRIRTDEGVYIGYWHILPSIPVKVGEVVKQGQVVGQMGNSGYVISMGKYVSAEDRMNKWKPGTHVHYEIFRVTDSGDRLYLDAREYTDWTIPVKVNLVTAWMKVLKSMMLITKGQ